MSRSLTATLLVLLFLLFLLFMTGIWSRLAGIAEIATSVSAGGDEAATIFQQPKVQDYGDPSSHA